MAPPFNKLFESEIMTVKHMRKPMKVMLYSLVPFGLALLALWTLNPMISSTSHASNQSLAAPEISRTDTDRRIERLQNSLNTMPNNSQGYLQLGVAYLQRARETADLSYYDLAESALMTSLDIDPENASVLTALGSVNLARHQFPQAMEWARRSLESQSLNPGAYGVLGDAQLELGLYDQAVQSVQAMVDIKPNLNSYARVAHIRRLMGDIEGAIATMQSAVEAGSPGTEPMAWALVQLGDFYFGSGRIEEAAAHYEAGLINYEDYHLALARLGRVRAAQGR